MSLGRSQGPQRELRLTCKQLQASPRDKVPWQGPMCPLPDPFSVVAVAVTPHISVDEKCFAVNCSKASLGGG